MDLQGKTALVTGAGSGIGRAISLSLARRGCSLALVDVDPLGLAETCDLAAQNGVRTSEEPLDVADREGVALLPQRVFAAHESVDILVNNAGVALAGTFEQVSEADFDWLFEINFHGLVRMTRAFLPFLRNRPEAQIVSISSVFGLISVPGQAAYCASKFAVRGFSNALRLELAGSSVGVTVAHPGGVATSIAKRARISSAIGPDERTRLTGEFEKMLKMPPREAGEIIVKAIEARRPRVLVGGDAKFVALTERLAPISNYHILSKLL